MKRISEKKLRWLLQQKLDMSNVVPKLNKLLANNSILVRFGMAGMAQNWAEMPYFHFDHSS